MPKQKTPDDPLTPAEAAKRRDAALKAMLKTPPRRHKDEPRRSAGTQKT